MRTIKKVDHDEELFISYTESLESTEERQKELIERYFFHCHCSLCTADPHQGKNTIIGKCRNPECKLPVVFTMQGKRKNLEKKSLALKRTLSLELNDLKVKQFMQGAETKSRKFQSGNSISFQEQNAHVGFQIFLKAIW